MKKKHKKLPHPYNGGKLEATDVDVDLSKHKIPTTYSKKGKMADSKFF